MATDEKRPRRRRPDAIPFIIAFIVWLIIVAIYFVPSLLKLSRISFDMWLNIGYLVMILCLAVAAISKFTLAPAMDAEEEGEETVPVEAEVVQEDEAAPATRPAGAAPRPKSRAAKAAPKEGAKASERPAGVVITPGAEEEEPRAVPRAALKAAPKRTPGPAPAPASTIAPTPATPPAEDVRIIEYPSQQLGEVYHDVPIQVDTNLVLNLRTRLGRVCGNCVELPECKKRVTGKLPDDIFEFNFECKEGLKRELNRARQAKGVEPPAKPTAPAGPIEVEPRKEEPAAAVPKVEEPVAAPPPPQPPAEVPLEVKEARMPERPPATPEEELEVGEDEEEAEAVAGPVHEPGAGPRPHPKKKKVLKKRAPQEPANQPVDTLPPDGL